MPVYKYVTSDGALRYLRTAAMRITPPDQFNDPFEMRPAFDLRGLDFRSQAPALVRKELADALAQAAVSHGFGASTEQASSQSAALISFLMREMPADEEAAFLRGAAATVGQNAKAMLEGLRTEFDARYERAMADAEALLPEFSKVVQSAMHNMLPRHIGVLCLSGSGRHPLMWAHYTDCHKGALLEFDESAPCFNRRRHAEDEFGYLHRVWYADARPTLSASRDSDAFVAMALTKALEWAYEQELRLLWPLEQADRTVDAGGQKVHLIEVPSTALRSVTIGCKASECFVKELLETVARAAPRAAVRVAVMDDHSFSLNYRNLG